MNSENQSDGNGNTDQCRCWDTVSNGYRNWWKQIEEGNSNQDEGAQKVSRRLLELAEIKPGYTVLDIATGYGEPAVSAAQCVGPQGHVLAVDTSPQMLEIAKERSTALGFQNITFDIAVCRWGLMFLTNLNTVLKKIYDTLSTGGRFAAAVWPDPSKVPFQLAYGYDKKRDWW